MMSNGDSIPISRNKRKEVRETLMKLGGEKL
ncbi:MAG: LytTR family transcriptional regulator DNA-binding domain-containing protein [[Eubacterium] saphenum]|nr:LytTR family transcriptional regulator DNA-binding domain-containing protein [[Eubacterium] saphenum]